MSSNFSSPLSSSLPCVYSFWSQPVFSVVCVWSVLHLSLTKGFALCYWTPPKREWEMGKEYIFMELFNSFTRSALLTPADSEARLKPHTDVMLLSYVCPHVASNCYGIFVFFKVLFNVLATFSIWLSQYKPTSGSGTGKNCFKIKAMPFSLDRRN